MLNKVASATAVVGQIGFHPTISKGRSSYNLHPLSYSTQLKTIAQRKGRLTHILTLTLLSNQLAVVNRTSRRENTRAKLSQEDNVDLQFKGLGIGTSCRARCLCTEGRVLAGGLSEAHVRVWSVCCQGH
jgi:hypothetical protein